MYLLQALDNSLQKKSYRIMEEICACKSEESREFVLTNLATIQTALLDGLSSSSPSSKAVSSSQLLLAFLIEVCSAIIWYLELQTCLPLDRCVVELVTRWFGKHIMYIKYQYVVKVLKLRFIDRTQWHLEDLFKSICRLYSKLVVLYVQNVY